MNAGFVSGILVAMGFSVGGAYMLPPNQTLPTPVLADAPRKIIFEVAPPVSIADDISDMATRPAVVSVTFGTLKGERLGTSNAWYVGVAGKVPDAANVDYDKVITDMWDRKLRGTTTAAARTNAKAMVERYVTSPRETMTLRQFVQQADSQISGSWRSLDFVGLCKRFKLDGERCVRLRNITGAIKGRDMIAYGMTEIFPVAEGDLNARALDVVLRNAGTSYLDAIPSMYDPLLSTGFYQLTSYAVRHDATNIEGASVVNLYAGKDYRIGGSVMAIQGAEQHRAAFYLATYNIARMLQALNPKQAATLKAIAPLKEADITTFIAVAHHLPSASIGHMQAWLQEGAKRNFTDYLGRALTQYADKTKSNLKALRA